MIFINKHAGFIAVSVFGVVFEEHLKINISITLM